ncbi:MAG: TonB-dependent receptor, partial [Gemmatimonadetes bacterium]|nr:TonB-dependent receptor [Gemmatimonadota bacterium]
VNRGITGGFAATIPAGTLALRAELSGRTAGNTQTPLGVLPTSQLDGYNGGFGASWAGERGFVGAAVRDYGIRYGVPGTFNGEVIPGGHEGGVEIELRRTALRMEGALFTGVAPFRSVKVDGNFVRFDQDEFELGGPSGPVVGTEYRQYTGTGNLIAPHEHEAGGLLVEGALGLWILGKDFSTAGSNTGSRPARQLALAGFIFEELNWPALHLEVGARYDWTRIDPLDTRPGTIGDVRTRDFGAVSASAAALYQMAPGWTAGVGLSRAFRTPSIEELFSNGPHLANYSFDIGNPDLGAEYGFGTDLFVRSSLPRINGELSVFRNAIRDYIYNAPTGGLDPRFGRFPVYQAEQSDAVLTGFEGRVQWEALQALVLDLSASYVRGTRRGDDGDVPLPMIPPLHGSVGARYDATSYFLGLSLEGAAQQSRTGEFESRSAGYSLLHSAGGIRWTAWGRLNTLTLQANNVLDTAWRDHLSRIKEVAPQPGRNLQLLYRVGF